MREIQQFTIDQDQTPECWVLIFDDPESNGGFFLTFTDNDGKTISTEENFTFDVDPSTLASNLNADYFRKKGFGHVEVTRTYFDQKNDETSDFSQAKRVMFEV